MKRYIILLVLITGACTTSSFDPAKKAERLVWRHYSDCREILMVDVDTVTLGDNLKFHIERQQESVRRSERDVKMYKGLVKEFRSSKVAASSYRKYLHRADSILNVEKLRLADLDSLRRATLDIADTPAAYQVCVAYNSPTNLVWIQFGEDGELLAMSKRMEDLYIKIGHDVPGYLETVLKHIKL